MSCHLARSGSVTTSVRENDIAAPSDSTAPPTVPAPVRSAHRSVAILFAVNGALLGTWAPRIPEVQQELGVGSATLGLVLFGLGCVS